MVLPLQLAAGMVSRLLDDWGHVLLLVLLIAICGRALPAAKRKLWRHESPRVEIDHKNEHRIERAAAWWRVAHPQGCPAVEDLAPYLARADIRDVYGNPYQLTCESDHIWAWGFGEDGRAGTDDDIRSNDE